MKKIFIVVMGLACLSSLAQGASQGRPASRVVPAPPTLANALNQARGVLGRLANLNVDERLLSLQASDGSTLLSVRNNMKNDITSAFGAFAANASNDDQKAAILKALSSGQIFADAIFYVSSLPGSNSGRPTVRSLCAMVLANLGLILRDGSTIVWP